MKHQIKDGSGSAGAQKLSIDDDAYLLSEVLNPNKNDYTSLKPY